jgi:hypothetical protein
METRMIWLDKLFFTLFPTSGRVYIWRTFKEAYNPEHLVPTVKQEGGSLTFRAAISCYSAGPIITLHGKIIARVYVDKLGNQVHPMIQTLFPNSAAIFQDDNAPTHTAGLKSMKANFNIFPGQHNHQM